MKYTSILCSVFLKYRENITGVFKWHHPFLRYPVAEPSGLLGSLRPGTSTVFALERFEYLVVSQFEKFWPAQA